MEKDSYNVTNPTLIDPNEFEFNLRLLLNILAYGVMCIIGTVGNALVFVAAYRQHNSAENQHGRRSNVHIMVVHLTIADLIVSFVVMPLEIGWRISVQWVAGNASCKGLMFIRAFAFYLSSATLVCLSVDRYLAIAQPMASLKLNKTKRRGKVMILLAWLVSAMFAIPQTWVFRVRRHPHIDFIQCTSMEFFSELMSIEKLLPNGTTVVETSEFLGSGPEVIEKIYSCIFLVAVYIVPLFAIIITYANILRKIIRKKQESDEDMPHHHYPNNISCQNRSARFARSQTVALRMSVVHVVAFVSCWTPHLVISVWHLVDPESVNTMVAPEIQDVLFLTAVFNSCVDPLVYGGFYFKQAKSHRKQFDPKISPQVPRIIDRWREDGQY